MTRARAELDAFRRRRRDFDGYTVSNGTSSVTFAPRPYTPQVCTQISIHGTWHAARRVAGALICADVRDVSVAWAVLYYVHRLPDGAARLKEAVIQAERGWAMEVEG